ncbi:hypothetical protein [Ekhidna sp.]|uniref:hypothetical protein n=1 Tax=Ekhidna sp. TaxID=2608089 RepID=UPI003C7BCBAB
MNKKNIVGIVFGTIIAGIVGIYVQDLFGGQQSFDKVMMQMASELNKTCPIMVDSETRLENSVTLPDNKFQYNYSLVNYTIEELDLEQLRSNIEPGIITNIRTNPDLKFFRENQITMIYSYKDKNEVHLFKIEVTPDLYN